MADRADLPQLRHRHRRLRSFTGHLIVDGYGAYQRLITGVDAVLAGIQQCVQHVLRRCAGWRNSAPAPCNRTGPGRSPTP
ncbi:transposase [Dactylosporangium sp. NPDC005555]|uniref:IS66 family transposase n=1 Tax=Dactylosporangium sp. NPDC005555 TaxID=3154889 RepID=UPI00339F0B51